MMRVDSGRRHCRVAMTGTNAGQTDPRNGTPTPEAALHAIADIVGSTTFTGLADLINRDARDWRCRRSMHGFEQCANCAGWQGLHLHKHFRWHRHLNARCPGRHTYKPWLHHDMVSIISGWRRRRRLCDRRVRSTLRVRHSPQKRTDLSDRRRTRCWAR
jgi:hypothetical protein